MGQIARAKLDGLEALRWFAAAAIIVYHVAKIPDRAPADAVMPVVQYLNFGVPLFYIVSAFGLWYGYLGRLETRGQVAQFYRRRFFRIAPLFYVMLAAYIVLLGFQVSPLKVLTSLLFVFNLVPSHVEGIVWASWSIGVEMLFYAIMPLLAVFVRGPWRAVAFFACAVLVGVAWHQAFADASGVAESFAYFSLVNYLYFFAAGIVASLGFVTVRRRHPVRQRALGLVLMPISAVTILVLAVVDHHEAPLVRAVWAIALSALVVALSCAPVRGLVNPVTQRLGQASFSLYLIHPLVIGVMDRGGLIERLYDAVGPLVGYFVAVVITFAIVIPLSLLTYRFIEQPGMKLGPAGSVREMTRRRREDAQTPSVV